MLIMFWKSGVISWDAAQEVEKGFLDGAGVFERCEVDALSAEWSALDVDFLKLIEEQVRKARSHLHMDEVVCGKIGFHFFMGFAPGWVSRERWIIV
jgi:hypothetical protein